jgi:hypothetical protein
MWTVGRKEEKRKEKEGEEKGRGMRAAHREVGVTVLLTTRGKVTGSWGVPQSCTEDRAA